MVIFFDSIRNYTILGIIFNYIEPKVTINQTSLLCSDQSYVNSFNTMCVILIIDPVISYSTYSL